MEKETKRKQLVVIVVDTIAGTASREELSADWDKDDYPRSPKMLRRGFRVLSRRLQRRSVALIMTNQVSHKFQQKTGGKNGQGGGFIAPHDDDYSSPGGKALKYYSHLRVFLVKERDYKLVKTSRFPSGFVSYVMATKNRRVPPSRFVRMCLLYHGGINNLYSVLETLCTDKTIAERGKDGVVFKLSANGIALTGPVDAPKTLDDLDEDSEPDDSVGTLKLERNIDWPSLWNAHPELQLLWDKMKVDMFGFDSLTDDPDSDVVDVDDSDEP